MLDEIAHKDHTYEVMKGRTDSIRVRVWDKHVIESLNMQGIHLQLYTGI